MKSLAFSLIATTALAAHAFSQTTATTDPVGFVVVPITGKGTNATRAYSLGQFPMMKNASYQGSATDSGTTAVLNVVGASFGENEFASSPDGPNYFLQVASGDATGLVADIQSNTADTVTVYSEDAAAIAAAMPATITIRAHNKVSEIFGTGTSLILQGGSSPTSADLLYFGRGGTLAGFYYKTGIGAGWKTLSGGAAPNIAIYPGESVLVSRNGASGISITNTGAVKAGAALVPVSQGSITAATSFPVGTTLATSGLYTGNASTGVQGGNSASSADILYIPDTNGSLVSYYYKTGIGAGWKTVAGGTNASTVEIPAVGGVLITRQSSTPFNWSIPQPYANN